MITGADHQTVGTELQCIQLSVLYRHVGIALELQSPNYLRGCCADLKDQWLTYERKEGKRLKREQLGCLKDRFWVLNSEMSQWHSPCGGATWCILHDLERTYLLFGRRSCSRYLVVLTRFTERIRIENEKFSLWNCSDKSNFVHDKYFMWIFQIKLYCWYLIV